MANPDTSKRKEAHSEKEKEGTGKKVKKSLKGIENLERIVLAE